MELDPRKPATEHWRFGLDKPIALLRQEPVDLERLGVVFEEDFDDLDYLRHARLETPSGRVFALVRHRGAPVQGTEVVTHVDSNRLADDLAEVLAHLGLQRSDVTWAHPDVEQAWTSDRWRELSEHLLRLLVLALPEVPFSGSGLPNETMRELARSIREELKSLPDMSDLPTRDLLLERLDRLEASRG